MKKQAIGKRNPLEIKVIEGKSIRLGERELVPVVRVTSHVRRRAFVGSDRVGVQGRGFVRMRPVALLERDEAGENHIPIQDKTNQVIGGLLLAAFIIPLLLAAAVHLARKN
ncbi:MAG: hypothetical protein SWK90_00175 [Chloroflexota bacterium]|nr:hypothetical protein [Chloroflexota bacterium]